MPRIKRQPSHFSWPGATQHLVECCVLGHSNTSAAHITLRDDVWHPSLFPAAMWLSQRITGETFRRTLKSPQIPGEDGQFSVEAVPMRADWTNVCDTFVCLADQMYSSTPAK